MIITADTTSGVPPEQRAQHRDPRFAAIMAQCGATPPFSLWPVADPHARSNAAAASSALNTHSVSSNRREGRHARG